MRSKLLSYLPLPLAVICHDAGGANQILALLKRIRLPKGLLRPVMQGPAADSWARIFPGRPTYTDIPSALSGAKAVLSGTGWASGIEHQARCMAARMDLPSITLLDHWVNYAERFVRDSHQQLPDQLLVCDKYAETLAREVFPKTPVRRIRDYYLAQQCAWLQPVEALSEPQLLFVCEPSHSNWGRDRAGELQALDYFMARIDATDIPPSTRILIRPHPSESPGKYAAWLAMQSRPGIAIDTNGDLHSALSRSRWVAGCQSYAMAVALAAGRTVYSVLPPWAPSCQLPHPGILHLKDL